MPEVASRRHLELVAPVIRAALDDAGVSLADVGRVGVTQGPGLVGALLVGLSAAKALAWARGLPLVPVDHLRAHVATLYLAPDPLEPPFTCLLASGGHTLVLRSATRTGFEVLGSTLDDAAGEAFDKGARLLGLGYPGGAEIDRLAREGDPEAFTFPVARVPGLDLSFSGLKTALLYAVRDLSEAELERGAPTSRPRTSARSCARSSDGCAQPRSRPATRRSRSSAAWRRTRSSAGASRGALRTAPALHRQRRDGGLRRALRARPRVARLPCARCVRVESRARSRRLAAMCVLAAGGAAGAADTPVGAEGWQGLLGSRPLPQLGGRWVVVLRAPSLADRVRRAGGTATELQMRAWTATAHAAQRRAIAGLWSRGAPVDPEQSYVRVLNGFAASVDPMLLPTLERDPAVAGVYPVRAAYPAEVAPPVLDTEAFGPSSGRRVGLELPGRDGTGVTVALLDTGVDTRHPFLQGRLLPGIDVLDADGDPSAEPNPTEPGRPERHATGLAGLVVGVRGPAGLHGVAPGASLLPIRVAGWQPDADGSVSVYGRTDQVLAGLEAAVDPNGDGDAHDGARIALVGVVEPFASFPDGPLARAGRGALALGTLVVAPAGNDGPAGPGYGSVAAPAGTTGVLGVAASDSRGRARPSTSCSAPGCASSPPARRLWAARPGRRRSSPRRSSRCRGVRSSPSRKETRSTASSTPTATAASRAARCCCRPGRRRPRPCASSRPRARARCSSTGRSPPGRSGWTSRSRCRSSASPAVAAEVRRSLAAGVPVELGVGAAAFGANPELGAVAPFSSTGLAFDGARAPRSQRPASAS